MSDASERSAPAGSPATDADPVSLGPAVAGRADAALVALGALFELLQGDRQLLGIFDERSRAARSGLQAGAATDTHLEAFDRALQRLRSRLTDSQEPNPMDVDART